MSRGVDLFIDDHSLLPNLNTMLSYSYNDSRRRYLNDLTEQQPPYVSRHNLRLALKYGISISNLLGRKNIYGYRGGKPITNGSDRFLYIGIFVSLKSNKAYDIANF